MWELLHHFSQDQLLVYAFVDVNKHPLSSVPLCVILFKFIETTLDVRKFSKLCTKICHKWTNRYYISRRILFSPFLLFGMLNQERKINVYIFSLYQIMLHVIKF
jgi:hypothetical protein